MKHLCAFCLGIMLVALSACTRNTVYCQYYPISSSIWSADTTLRFDFHIDNAEATYSTLLYLRHNERYPYQNMWVFIDNGTQKDTIEFYLADDRGRWLGDKHHGFIEMPVLLDETKHFPDTGSYHLYISHGMRDSLLRGVTDVGVEIIRNSEH